MLIVYFAFENNTYLMLKLRHNTENDPFRLHFSKELDRINCIQALNATTINPSSNSIAFVKLLCIKQTK